MSNLWAAASTAIDCFNFLLVQIISPCLRHPTLFKYVPIAAAFCSVGLCERRGRVLILLERKVADRMAVAGCRYFQWGCAAAAAAAAVDLIVGPTPGCVATAVSLSGAGVSCGCWNDGRRGGLYHGYGVDDIDSWENERIDGGDSEKSAKKTND